MPTGTIFFFSCRRRFSLLFFFCYSFSTLTHFVCFTLTARTPHLFYVLQKIVRPQPWTSVAVTTASIFLVFCGKSRKCFLLNSILSASSLLAVCLFSLLFPSFFLWKQWSQIMRVKRNRMRERVLLNIFAHSAHTRTQYFIPTLLVVLFLIAASGA